MSCLQSHVIDEMLSRVENIFNAAVDTHKEASIRVVSAACAFT